MRQNRVRLSVAVLLLFTLETNASAQVFRCVGHSARSGTEITLDIVMPQNFDSYLEILDRQTEGLKSVSHNMVGEGIIEVKKLSSKPERFSFVVTRRPSAENLLYGFYIDGDIPVVVNIDTWKKEKPFFLYDPLFYPGSVVSGTCK